MQTRARLQRNCLRRGYDVVGGGIDRNFRSATIQGYEKSTYEVDLRDPGFGRRRYRFDRFQTARTFALSFADGSLALAMHRAAGGSFDDFMAGRRLELPYEELDH